MVPLSAKTREHVVNLFSVASQAEAIGLLEKHCAESLPLAGSATPESLERIRFAVLKLSKGTLPDLCNAIDLAAADWRDLLVAADFADDTSAHLKWSPDVR